MCQIATLPSYKHSSLFEGCFIHFHDVFFTNMRYEKKPVLAMWHHLKLLWSTNQTHLKMESKSLKSELTNIFKTIILLYINHRQQAPRSTQYQMLYSMYFASIVLSVLGISPQPYSSTPLENTSTQKLSY